MDAVRVRLMCCLWGSAWSISVLLAGLASGCASGPGAELPRTCRLLFPVVLCAERGGVYVEALLEPESALSCDEPLDVHVVHGWVGLIHPHSPESMPVEELAPDLLRRVDGLIGPADGLLREAISESAALSALRSRLLVAQSDDDLAGEFHNVHTKDSLLIVSRVCFNPKLDMNRVREGDFGTRAGSQDVPIGMRGRLRDVHGGACVNYELLCPIHKVPVLRVALPMSHGSNGWRIVDRIIAIIRERVRVQTMDASNDLCVLCPREQHRVIIR